MGRRPGQGAEQVRPGDRPQERVPGRRSPQTTAGVSGKHFLPFATHPPPPPARSTPNTPTQLRVGVCGCRGRGGRHGPGGSSLRRLSSRPRSPGVQSPSGPARVRASAGPPSLRGSRGGTPCLAQLPGSRRLWVRAVFPPSLSPTSGSSPLCHSPPRFPLTMTRGVMSRARLPNHENLSFSGLFFLLSLAYGNAPFQLFRPLITNM